jgi:hypothetical protein
MEFFLVLIPLPSQEFFVPKGKCIVKWIKKWQEFPNLQVYVSFVFFQTIRFFLIKLQQCIDFNFFNPLKTLCLWNSLIKTCVQNCNSIIDVFLKMKSILEKYLDFCNKHKSP